MTALTTASVTGTQPGLVLADVVPGMAGRIPVLGELPYYRAAPHHWPSALRALRDVGVDVVTAYVPWRLHETMDAAGARSCDFDGRTTRQANLLGFLRAARECGLFVLLRPGPFVFAEVRLGGLPDHVTPGECAPALDRDGREHRMEDRPLPSAFDPVFRRLAREWLAEVRAQVIEPMAYPAGPVVAVQLGNEGIFEGIDGADFSEPARKSGSSLRTLLGEYREAIGTAVPALISLPLPHVTGDEADAGPWLCRSSRMAPDGVMTGHTSWIGNACLSDEALVGLWFGARALRSDTVEDNWGFTWTDASYAAPLVPVYHALLGLAFGSSTVSAYTACTTHTWPDVIAPDVPGLLKSGKDPKTYASPYCPGAPLDESGASKLNATGLRLLSTFLRWHGDVLRAARPDPDVWLVADPVTVAHDGGSSLDAALRTCGDLLLRGRLAVDVATVADLERPSAGRRSAGSLSATHWVVVGGTSMSERVQRALAARVRAGDRCAVIGRLPACDEHGSYFNDLALAIGEPSGFGSSADAARDNTDVAARPRRPVLSFLRSDPDSGSDVLYLFNRTDAEVVHHEDVAGVPVTVRLCQRGAAVVVLRHGKLAGFCVKAVNEITGESCKVDLAAGEDRVQLAEPADATGRLTGAGWEIALYPPGG